MQDSSVSSSSGALTDMQIWSMALNPSLPVGPRQLSFLQEGRGTRGFACFSRNQGWVAVTLLNVNHVIRSSVSPVASCSLHGQPGLTGKVRIGPLERVLMSSVLVCLPLAMGLAALEVMQAVHRTWTNSKVRMNGKTRLLQWRDMFDIAVKWRR